MFSAGNRVTIGVNFETTHCEPKTACLYVTFKQKKVLKAKVNEKLMSILTYVIKY